MEEFVSPVAEGERPTKRTPNKSNWKKTKDKIARHKPTAMPDYPTCKHFEGPFKCRSLTMREVQNFHASFYKHADRNHQDNFILRYTENRPVQRRRSRKTKTKEKPQLKRTTKYFVRDREGGKVPVCMTSFMGILNVSRFRVNRLTNTYKTEGEVREKRGGFRKSKKYDDKKKCVMKFINTLKCTEVHYCREKSTRKYLPSELNVKKLWRMYSSKPENLPVKLSYFRMIFNTKYNVGFGMPQTDVCSTCLRLRERIKIEKDPHKKIELMTEKRVHRLQYKAFFEKLKDEDPETLLLSFDCQKNLALPKIPDQSAYYSRQFYFQNFTVVKGNSKSPLNPTTVTAYCWTENEYHKDSNLISSCVLDALQSIDLSQFKRIRLISDGCGGQNKNSILVAMIHSWFGRYRPNNIEEIQIVFPVTGHSFLPADRVFGVVEKELRKREEIINPNDIIDIISAHATVKRVGVDCEVGDFRSVALRNLKDLKQWNFQISKCKRIHFTKSGNGQVIYTRGENTYITDLGKKQVLTKKGVIVTTLNPDVIEKTNSVTEDKKKDVDKLLCKHFGDDWKNNESLKFYKQIIEGATSEANQLLTLCEPQEANPVFLI